MFHDKRHPNKMGADEVESFLPDLAVVNRVSTSTQNQALLLVAQLLYGSGLRVVECLRLRVKDVDFGQNMIVVRDGKGGKDRTITLPDSGRHCPVD